MVHTRTTVTSMTKHPWQKSRGATWRYHHWAISASQWLSRLYIHHYMHTTPRALFTWHLKCGNGHWMVRETCDAPGRAARLWWEAFDLNRSSNLCCFAFSLFLGHLAVNLAIWNLRRRAPDLLFNKRLVVNGFETDKKIYRLFFC